MSEKSDERFEKWLSEHTSADFAPKKQEPPEELSQEYAVSSSAGVSDEETDPAENSEETQEAPQGTRDADRAGAPRDASGGSR